MKRIGFSKRASESIAIPTVVQIALAILFISVILLFANQTIGGRSVYEEVYAKKIALMIDGARPGSVFYLEVSDILALSKDKEYCNNGDSGKNNCFFVDEEKKEVVVSLDSTSYPYRYSYFSDYKVEIRKNLNKLIISVEEKDNTGGKNE